MLEQISLIENTRSPLRSKLNEAELVQLIATNCTVDGANVAAENLHFYRYSTPTECQFGLYEASVFIVAQGAKQARFGEQWLRYDPHNYLVVSLDVPAASQVTEASAEKPYYGIKLDLDPAVISAVIAESGFSSERNHASISSMATSPIGDDLFEAFLRLARLADQKHDYKMLSGLVIREIIYRILKSDQSERLRQMAKMDGQNNRMTEAIKILKRDFDKTLNVQALARELNMSLSSFHRHFKTATTMSPIQFQKSLRLQEARKLLISGNLAASEVAMHVGYEDPSQFTREYKRQYGEPPMKDRERLQLISRNS